MFGMFIPLKFGMFGMFIPGIMPIIAGFMPMFIFIIAGLKPGIMPFIIAGFAFCMLAILDAMAFICFWNSATSAAGARGG
jgi:hypothetical protein